MENKNQNKNIPRTKSKVIETKNIPGMNMFVVRNQNQDYIKTVLSKWDGVASLQLFKRHMILMEVST